MQVVVIFEYPGVEPISPEADKIILSIENTVSKLEYHCDAKCVWFKEALTDDGKEPNLEEGETKCLG